MAESYTRYIECGAGIQRRYAVSDKRFSLFNTSRWGDAAARPACCGVVPVLWTGLMCELDTNEILRKLVANGSYASPGFMDPEGIVVFHTANGVMFKRTVAKDEQHKGQG